jgi:peptidoglycan/LPS O-acetylase OafA/YrhL
MKPTKLHAIDSLRGLAALQVIAFHLACIPTLLLAAPNWLLPLVQHGNSGVTLFFIVSAFTLCLSVKSRSNEVYPITSFYLRRVFRIAPLFLVWLGWMLFRSRHTLPPLVPDVLANLTFTFNFFPGMNEGIVWASWTLGVEMVFYVMFPLVFNFTGSLARAVLFLALSIGVSIGTWKLISMSNMPSDKANIYFLYSFFRHLPSFATGIICFHLYQNYLAGAYVAKKSTSTLLLIIILLAYLVRTHFSFSIVADILVDDLLYSLILLSLINLSPKFLVNKTTGYIGEISYSLYLGHVPVISWIAPIFTVIYAQHISLTLKFGSSFLLTAFCAFATSLVTYYFIERPGMTIGKKVVKYLNAKTGSLAVAPGIAS